MNNTIINQVYSAVFLQVTNKCHILNVMIFSENELFPRIASHITISRFVLFKTCLVVQMVCLEVDLKSLFRPNIKCWMGFHVNHQRDKSMPQHRRVSGLTPCGVLNGPVYSGGRTEEI